MNDNEKLDVTIYKKRVSCLRFLGSPKSLGLSFPGEIGMHFKLIFAQNLVFSWALRVARIPLTLPFMEIARTLISCIWTSCQLSLNAKGSGDLFCTQAAFQNGQPVENTLQKGPKFPSKGPSLLFSYGQKKCQESLKLMATNWKRKKN